MDNYIGRLLENRYEILEAIGHGGMAVVYKARCHRLNRLVAIKILKDELSQDAEFRRRFHAESQAVAMLSHTNIVNVYDVSHSEHVDYIVMELIDGITLKQYMQQKGVLNWREVLHFSTQIAKALEHAHGRGIIHRDIKPHNIMILKDGSVKVADFGIARVSSAQSTLTREALGSVHYISPEQAKGSKIDYRSDLYSLGVVMYEMLTGQTPYDGESPVSVAIQHINAQAPHPRTLNPQIPFGLDYICMHAMEADLDKRYENATQMLFDLDEFRRNPNINFGAVHESVELQSAKEMITERPVVTSPVKRTTVKTVEVPSKKNRSNTVALAAGIVCIALAMSLIGYFLYSFFFADFFTETAEIEVPNFVGSYSDEINYSNYPNFLIQIKEWVPDETVPVGQVVNQEPYGGRMAKSGSTISLIVSSGPSTDMMRNLINSTESNARTILENLALDLDIRTVPESSDIYMKDAVIRTDPAKDEPLSVGQTVILYVSTGPDITLYEVPELVGRDIETAMNLLDAMNLKYNVSYVNSEEANGTVIFQSIKQLEMVKEGTTINLQVSKGPVEENNSDIPVVNPDPEEQTPVFSDPKVIYLPMPQGKGTVEVTILLDGEVSQQIELELATISERGLPFAPKGARGISLIEVYLDDEVDGTYNKKTEPYYAVYYDFDSGKQVEE